MKASLPSPFAYAHASWFLGCEEKAIRAVAQVEAGPLGGFLNSGDPVILYERHIFDRQTAGAFRANTLTIGNHTYKLSDPTSGDYGSTAIQYDKLMAALKLNRSAAMKACSWGLFQILGLNFARCGFDSVESFVKAMEDSVDEHLKAFVSFVRSDHVLLAALIAKEWSTVAQLYNGPNYEINHYDQKLVAAYAIA